MASCVLPETLLSNLLGLTNSSLIATSWIGTIIIFILIFVLLKILFKFILGRESDINLLFYLFLHSLVDSFMCLDQGIKPAILAYRGQ